jgi:nucleoside phosphorylase
VHSLLVVAATEGELRGAPTGVDTLVCGVGPVEAAARTAATLARSSPGALLQVGIAGARGFGGCELVLGAEAVYSDATDERWIPLRVRPDPGLLAAAQTAFPDARTLPIGTSAKVGGGGCEVEAMEGYAVLRAAALAGVPALEVRVLSNEVGEPDRSRWLIDEALAFLAESLPALVGALG